MSAVQKVNYIVAFLQCSIVYRCCHNSVCPSVL